MLATVNWDQVGIILAGCAAVLYPPLGLAWRWISSLEHRFTKLQASIDHLGMSDEVDVNELKAFKDDVGRRIDRLEGKVFQ